MEVLFDESKSTLFWASGCKAAAVVVGWADDTDD